MNVLRNSVLIMGDENILNIIFIFFFFVNDNSIYFNRFLYGYAWLNSWGMNCMTGWYWKLKFWRQDNSNTVS
jgi:hypothetical protein